MNKKLVYFLLLGIIALMVACSTDNAASGESLLDDRDRIVVGVDTFGTNTYTQDVTALLSDSSIYNIYSTPDSFLLGQCDGRFGTLQADILAQFTCPIDFKYPEGAEVDSVCLFFAYKTWFGDGHTPMSLDIYRLSQALDYNTAYPHNLQADDYVDFSAGSVLARQRILVAATPTDSTYDSNNSVYVPFVRCRLTDEFAQELFSCRDFSSQEVFNEAFKGLYITSDFGSATLLHVTDINIALYYHYSYDKSGRDTTVTDVKGFYANTEVRQINRYHYFTDTDTEAQGHDRASLLADTTRNFVVAPANIYTRVSIPIKEMAYDILSNMSYTRESASGVDTLWRRPYINKAAISLEVLNYYDGSTKKTRDDWAQPSPYMLLIKESSVARFFSEHELPSDTCAILSSIAAETLEDTDSVRYYYTYDLSELLTEEIRNIEADTVQVSDSLHMVLMPVSVTSTTTSSSYYSSGTTSITAVKQEQLVSATEILKPYYKGKPLPLEVVYSGF